MQDMSNETGLRILTLRILMSKQSAIIQSWQWVTFCDRWPIWPISELTHDPRDPRPTTHDPWLTSYDYCKSSANLLHQSARHTAHVAIATHVNRLITVTSHMFCRSNTKNYWNFLEIWLTSSSVNGSWVTGTDPWPTRPIQIRWPISPMTHRPIVSSAITNYFNHLLN